MHLFFETVWKLHPGEIPEKPKYRNFEKVGRITLHDTKKYSKAIAAIKQNALIVGNPEILKQFGYLELPINGDFVKWPGCYETLKTLHCDEYHQHTKNSCFTTVAILTLPEEKKNTMENKTIEEKADEYIKRYLPHVDTTGHWLGFQDGYKQALAEISGSVAAPKKKIHIEFDKEEYIKSLVSDLYQARQQIKEREEALKGFAQILLDYKHSGVEANIDYLLDKFPYENIKGKV